MRETLESQSVKAALITAPNPWQMVDVYASIDSTNLEALREPRPWRVVVADYQSAGRGRLARRWRAPAGASIAVSAVVPIPVDRTADWGWLPLLTGMAMRAALADVAQVAGRLKWPNDVLAQEGTDDPGSTWLKISGILCEMVPGGGLVVIGAGANIDQERSELPVVTATSLALCGARNVRREEVIVAYLGELADLHRLWSAGGAGLEAIRAAYRSSCLTIGLDVDVHQPDGRVARGTATGVDDAGRLVVEADGSSTAHAAGDIVHVRRSQPVAGHTA
ncbi:MAG: biotin--[acetyl-CoA-carboxylase] ligase [Actinobacteria bacterium]|nr:biotin--[acetyl-CoA-carboxylase] ligase [Actinomycetota bacterium]